MNARAQEQGDSSGPPFPELAEAYRRQRAAIQCRCVEGSLEPVGIPDVIRPCAFSFVREGRQLLFARMRDADGGADYFRPLGGGIEFGETGEQAVRREFREELDVDLANVQHLGFLENLFQLSGRSYHELCLIFVAEPNGWHIADFDGYVVPESVGLVAGETAIVHTLDEAMKASPMYPDGVTDFLRGLIASL